MLTRDETYDDDEIDDEMSEEHDKVLCRKDTKGNRYEGQGRGGKSHRLGRSREGSVKGGRPVER